MRTCPRDDALRRLRHAGELTRAARQNDPAAGVGGKARVLQPIAHEFQNFLDARPDYSRPVATLAHGSDARRPRRPERTEIVSRSSEAEAMQAP